jgi:hypothetical protein
MSSDNTATERMAAKYRDLIADFVGGRVSAQNFESAYLQVFKKCAHTGGGCRRQRRRPDAGTHIAECRVLPRRQPGFR